GQRPAPRAGGPGFAEGDGAQFSVLVGRGPGDDRIADVGAVDPGAVPVEVPDPGGDAVGLAGWPVPVGPAAVAVAARDGPGGGAATAANKQPTCTRTPSMSSAHSPAQATHRRAGNALRNTNPANRSRSPRSRTRPANAHNPPAPPRAGTTGHPPTDASITDLPRSYPPEAGERAR
ncbi:MAG: hypothetical protein ACRD0H_00950, partial [Actinomycetes bacterium]